MALDFRSSKPNMFAPPLDACLQALHTLRWETTEADWHPAPLTLKKLPSVQVLYADSLFCMPLLYTPPIPQNKCSMDGWKYGMELMDSPPFYHQLQECKGLQTPWNVPIVGGTTHTRCTIHHHCLITSRHRKKNFYSELIKRVSTNEELYLIFYVDWVL